MATAANSDWERIANKGMGNPGVHMIAPAAVFGGELYFVVGSPQTNPGELPPAPIYAYDGYQFRVAAPAGFGNPDNQMVFPTVVYKGALYAGTQKNRDDGMPGELWGTTDGKN